MRVLVWHWGRRGGGPRYAVELAEGLRQQPGVQVWLSLAARAEILAQPGAPGCDWPVPTYAGWPGLLARWLGAPWMLVRLVRRLRQLAPLVAICAMPGPLDLVMALALRRVGCRLVVVVHDATPHPGDGWPGQALLQRALLRRADRLVALSQHVADALARQGFAGVHVSRHPPRSALPPPVPHDGPLRLLCYGRLLPYKGLDLLAAALARLGARADLRVRVVGAGPEAAALAALRALPGVAVENRWVPEMEMEALLAWADAVVLPYREASQSGIAAAALSAGRHVLGTDVGGLRAQLDGIAGALCPPTAEGLAVGLRDLLEVRRFTPVPALEPWRDWQAALAALAVDLRRL